MEESLHPEGQGKGSSPAAKGESPRITGEDLRLPPSPMAWLTAWTDSLAWQSSLLLLLPVVLILLSLAAGRRRADGEKLSSYECGFEPVGDARLRFDVFYYVVGLLFLLFDLEIVLLVPYALAASSFEGPWALTGVTVLFTLLTLGFIYEWTRGALKVVRERPRGWGFPRGGVSDQKA